ncbi:hypothetical protein GJ496_005036 [Pomphorhynchus laevis]|nr:hypothetical protein GJ496_005036 [Pomphorhynchus laevis]
MNASKQIIDINKSNKQDQQNYNHLEDKLLHSLTNKYENNFCTNKFEESFVKSIKESKFNPDAKCFTELLCLIKIRRDYLDLPDLKESPFAKSRDERKRQQVQFQILDCFDLTKKLVTQRSEVRESAEDTKIRSMIDLNELIFLPKHKSSNQANIFKDHLLSQQLAFVGDGVNMFQPNKTTSKKVAQAEKFTNVNYRNIAARNDRLRAINEKHKALSNQLICTSNFNEKLCKKVQFEDEYGFYGDDTLNDSLDAMSSYLKHRVEGDEIKDFPEEHYDFAILKLFEGPVYIQKDDASLMSLQQIGGTRVNSSIPVFTLVPREVVERELQSQMIKNSKAEQKKRKPTLQENKIFKGKYNLKEEVLYKLNPKEYFNKKHRYVLSTFNNEQIYLSRRILKRNSIKSSSSANSKRILKEKLKKSIETNRDINKIWFDNYESVHGFKPANQIIRNRKYLNISNDTFPTESEYRRFHKVHRRNEYDNSNRDLYHIAKEYGELPKVTERLYRENYLKRQNKKIDYFDIDKISSLARFEIDLLYEYRTHIWKRRCYLSGRNSSNSSGDLVDTKSVRPNLSKSSQVFDFILDDNAGKRCSKSAQTFNNELLELKESMVDSLVNKIVNEISREAVLELEDDLIVEYNSVLTNLLEDDKRQLNDFIKNAMNKYLNHQIKIEVEDKPLSLRDLSKSDKSKFRFDTLNVKNDQNAGLSESTPELESLKADEYSKRLISSVCELRNRKCADFIDNTQVNDNSLSLKSRCIKQFQIQMDKVIADNHSKLLRSYKPM